MSFEEKVLEVANPRLQQGESAYFFNGTLNMLRVYQGLGVQEVWFWRKGKFEIYSLVDADREYEAQEKSLLLPQLDFNLLTQFIDNPQQTQAVKVYRKALKT